MAGGNIPANLAPLFVAAGQAYNIPPAVLAGIASVETNLGQNRGPSSAGAVGLMQFLPSTAAGLGVNPLDDRSAIFGTAKYLTQLGYGQNPQRAIGAYNGGPGNPQSGYASQVMAEAARLSGQLHGVQGALPSVQAPSGAAATSSSGATSDPSHAILAAYLKSTPSGLWNTGSSKGTDFGGGSGALINYLTAAQSNLQALSGSTVLTAHPAVQRATSQVLQGGIGGGFLPKGAQYIVGRKDQGRDGQTNPGGPIIAPGAGYVVRIGNNPGGFGPRYPIVHFTTGPYAGRTIYLGHTLADVTSGSFQAGQVLSHTGTHGIGNATVPGWFEIGFADSGSPGPMGQQTPF